MQLFQDNLIGGKKELASILPSNLPASEIPEAFSDFFQERVKQFRENLPAPPPPPESEPPSHEFSRFKPVNEEFVRKLIMETTPKTSALDPIPTPLVKDCCDELVPVLTKLINSSLETGVFPDNLKTAVIRPLLKKASLDSDVLKNFRPVANVPFLSKLIEKTVKLQMDEYLTENNLFTKFQSAQVRIPCKPQY